jgi:hypothetical protein
MPATSTSDYWQNLRSQVTGLVIDAARAKYVDVETRADDRNIRDGVDAKTGNVGQGGFSPLTVVLVIVAAVAGVVLLKRVL